MDANGQTDVIDADDEDIDKIKAVIKTEPDTTYPRTMRIEGNVVFMKQTTELKDGVHYFEYGLNMESVDGDDVIFHAAKDINIVIMRPRLFKKLTSAEVAKLDHVLDPMDYPASVRVGVSKREQKVNMLVEMGLPKEKAEHIADNPAKALEIIAEFETSRESE